jgi:murein DD-endopeptidase MepM/ murein hydrolase activator NlpD
VLEAEIARQRDGVERKKDQIAADKAELESHLAAVDEVRDRRADALAEREAAVAAKRSLLAKVESRADRLRRIHEQLARESARIEFLLAAEAFGPVPDALANGRLAWPAQGPMTSGFGPRTHPIFGDSRVHTGIDIAAPYGAPVWAAARGVVVYVGTLSGYGNTIIVDHGGGLATTYNHLSGFLTGSGTSVARGEPIGRVGCTGYCTGPHLHFEVRVDGTPVDPLPYLR